MQAFAPLQIQKFSKIIRYLSKMLLDFSQILQNSCKFFILLGGFHEFLSVFDEILMNSDEILMNSDEF